MAKIVNWKLVFLVIGIFSISMFILPGAVTESMAAHNPAGLAGILGADTTVAGITVGTLAVGFISLAALLSIIFLASEGGDSTVTHQ